MLITYTAKNKRIICDFVLLPTQLRNYFTKEDPFSYALGTKFANVQQKILSDTMKFFADKGHKKKLPF